MEATMKNLKLWLSAVVSIALLSHSTSKSTLAQASSGQQTCAPEITQASLATLNGWLQALFSGTAGEALPKYWSTDAKIELPSSLPYGGTYSAFDPKYGMAVMTAWDTQNISATPKLDAACDKVFLQSRWNATAKKTGIKVDTPLLEVFTVQNGKIVHDQLYFFDLKVMLDALK
jgi:hypothetical protein